MKMLVETIILGIPIWRIKNIPSVHKMFVECFSCNDWRRLFAMNNSILFSFDDRWMTSFIHPRRSITYQIFFQDFETRSLIAKECIHIVCQAAETSGIGGSSSPGVVKKSIFLIFQKIK